MNDRYRQCACVMKEVHALAGAASLLSWDQETMMPVRASQFRADQVAALASLIHEKFTNPQLGEDLRNLAAQTNSIPAGARANVREWLRDYEKETKLPAPLVREIAKTRSLALTAWSEARRKSDFKAFAPWLKKTFELKRQAADAIGYRESPYDPLLDDFEPGMTVNELEPIMATLRRELVPIVQAIHASGVKIDTRVLSCGYPPDEQELVCREVAAALGLSMDAARLDRSRHPFCTGIASPGDVRITTRYDKKWLPQALYGVIHETGHALYEQGFEERHVGTPLAQAVSMGIHESQSRLWENVVGRSRSFVTFLLPKLRRHFPQQLAGVKADTFYRAVNDVKANPIRVESDEVTYNLHLVLRYEIEKGLLEGKLHVHDLPDLWRERMKLYLGLTPKNDAEGVLQDIHWPGGMIGYFPSYMLGNLYAAQMWQKLLRDVGAGDVERHISRGDFRPILSWLRTKIHKHGRFFTAAELMKRVTGRPPAAGDFLHYLRTKFGEIYRIRWNATS